MTQLVLCQARALHMHRQAGNHIPRAVPGGVSKPLCPRSLEDMTVLSLGFSLTGFSNFLLKRLRNLGSIGRMYFLEATRLEGRQLFRLQDQSFGGNT